MLRWGCSNRATSNNLASHPSPTQDCPDPTQGFQFSLLRTLGGPISAAPAGSQNDISKRDSSSVKRPTILEKAFPREVSKRPSGQQGQERSLKPPYPQESFGQVPSVVDASVHGHKPLKGGLVFDVGIVQAGVQHDDGEGEDIAGVCQKNQEKGS